MPEVALVLLPRAFRSKFAELVLERFLTPDGIATLALLFKLAKIPFPLDRFPDTLPRLARVRQLKCNHKSLLPRLMSGLGLNSTQK